jgi:hypothetical protein
VPHPAFPKPDMLRKTIQAHVHEGGERPARLAQIFDRAIIRHRPQHVKQAFSLPPLSKRTVQIDMEDSERRVYNSLLALFVSNAVTSQRVDVDYLFHSSKRAHLDTLSENVASATTFFGSQDFIQQISDARKFAKEMSASYKSLAWTDEERVKEAQVIEVFDEVLADPAACLTVDYPSIAFEVTGFPNDLFSTFRGLHGEGATLVPASELVRLRVDVTELRRVDVKEWDDEEEFVEELLTFEQKRKRIDARPKNYKPDEDEQPLFKKRGKNAKVELAALPDVIQRIQLGRTTSAKINHIIGELKRYPNDKVRCSFVSSRTLKLTVLACSLSSSQARGSTCFLPTCPRRSICSASATRSLPAVTLKAATAVPLFSTSTRRRPQSVRRSLSMPNSVVAASILPPPAASSCWNRFGDPIVSAIGSENPPEQPANPL